MEDDMPSVPARHRRPLESPWSAARTRMVLLAVIVGVIVAGVWVMLGRRDV
ncbi:putative membrane protein [Streptomyces davaonensis JCM 4913]|uniref:Putative membrane protein n=1 Tax=Streptomyces davaonensis (strain DSM 101723 / JCM 4913 / KCC S-0913 / 768) TaxID=1214101 RepID=K4QSM2_STRDJ|nr:hypothetical protein [Streptomyces davaonensis]CCK24896.1 putative membrane protein [Streptomyces davaonensis JCM 4913]